VDDAVIPTMVMPAVALHEVGKQVFVFGREVFLQRGFDRLAMARGQIDAKFLRERHQIASGIAIAGGKLNDKLFDAGRTPSENAVLLALSKVHLRVERSFQYRPEIRCDRRRLAVGARRIAALAGFELKSSRRTRIADRVGI
jgi:hypothetical protein